MIGDFINLWAVHEGEIVEKVHVRLTIHKNSVVSRGIYISNIPVNYKNGQHVTTTRYTNVIERTFNNMDDADDYLQLSFDEFVEKYPKHEGKAKFDKIFYINGKRFSSATPKS